ncbi:hypothetical protein CH378_18060 [Leptospira kmetyi]|uniref:Uncharacterized protein n=1 Tax=Leptospira kmetyi TaxID=408139 RepID=A0ABX4N4X6_9LEPT|nr:hypothetical protein CH378_18060 [Leptospira kmetyi]
MDNVFHNQMIKYPEMASSFLRTLFNVLLPKSFIFNQSTIINKIKADNILLFIAYSFKDLFL